MVASDSDDSTTPGRPRRPPAVVGRAVQDARVTETTPKSPEPDCAFKDLCLDASESESLARFWAGLLHRELLDTEDGGFAVLPDGESSEHMWVDPVPEPRSVKSRVHLDLRLAGDDVSPVVDAGATLVHERSETEGWWVLADPDGNPFCAMPPAPPEYRRKVVPVPTPFELVVDSADPEAQASWWADRTGGTAQTRPGAPYWWIEGAAGFPFAYWVFNRVPEPKTTKNRMHWDVVLAAGAGSPKALVAAGATVLRTPDDEIHWWVLADPEGNEFCAFTPG